MTLDPRDRVAFLLTIVVGLFLLLSMVGVFILAWNDKAGENLWSALFALATALLGGVTGYLAGTSTTRRNGRPPDDGGPEAIYRPPGS
jgi:drug/metabolite transporter (DMT)-like permease